MAHEQLEKPFEDIVNEVQDYGLTRNEARVLTFLAKIGPSKAIVVARSLRMNRTETYRTLRNLHRRGLVESTLEHPVRFQSVPFEKCLDVLIEDRKNKTANLEQRSQAILARFKSVLIETGIPAVERFQVLEGRSRINQRTLDLIRKSKFAVESIVTLSDFLRGDTSGLLDALKERSKFGLRIRMVTEITDANRKIAEQLKSFVEIRHLDLTKRPVPRVGLIDDNEAVFAISTSEDSGGLSAEEVALWINSRPFIRSLRAYFEEIWDSAIPADVRLEAITKGVPTEDLRLLKGRTDVRKKLSEMFSSANRSLDVWTTQKGIDLIGIHRIEQLEALRSKSVRIRIIAPITPENIESARKLARVAELRHSDPLGPARVAVADNTELMLYERIPDDDSIEDGADVGFWTNSKPLIDMISRAYDAVWKGVLAVYIPRPKKGLRTR